MSLYHEAADILSAPSSSGGNLKTRIFGSKNKQLKSPPQQIYALALETCKWSSVLREVIDASELLRHERKLTPLLALLLVHDFLLARKGIALPASHGLRAAIERHKARLTAELTRARLRRRAGSIDALRELVEVESLGEAGSYPRWVRVNTFKTTLQDQLDTTFKDFTQVASVKEVIAGPVRGKLLHVDEHVPNLLALSPAFEITKTHAYTSGAIIIQDKASCFPAYLLNPQPEDGDVIDSCSAPGNKTTHVAAIVKSHVVEGGECEQKVYAFEKDPHRGRTLDKMVNLAGAHEITRMSLGRDFLKVDPNAPLYKNVGALLLDPSCSGSGIVGRDAMPTIHVPERLGGAAKQQPAPDKNRKRKRADDTASDARQQILVDDDGQELVVSSEKEMRARLEALSSFQLTLLLHAFAFPAARRITYSTCSVHAEENEQVVLKALRSEAAVARGWRIMGRGQQVQGMREWPVRGSLEASDGDEEVATACIRSYKDDGRGVMGFFVAGFVRDPRAGAEEAADAVRNNPREKSRAGQPKDRDSPHDNSTSKQPPSEIDSGSSDTGDPDNSSDDGWGGFTD
ncbi:putative NOL1R protein [Rosellinia necatrix]|uniref:Putative NOL1R protein n=1 Tax=Rosellinia necatrix TaxID=77044 RepID=A0A1W2TNP8_ROSNE|nr:putative NOL1R protein [Rosellinia necatrix]